MNESIKKYIYILMVLCVVFAIGSLFIKILPWLILAGIIAYIIIKVKGFINKKKNSPKESYSSDSNEYSNKNIYESSPDDYTNGEVIDVDYEDVDNK